MDLRAKYDRAIQTAKSVHMQGSAQQEGDKLHFHGTVQSDDEKNQIWNAIKTVPDWQKDIDADIRVSPQSQPQPVGTSGSSSARTYTVKAGDTLSKIAREHLGDANAYTRIFEANRDVLSDPNKIQPGQTLKIPV
ncbi:MAG TPA: LysM peptidoglycan-binding domain-containing protein [Vicinamibacterales bacterium]|nr:LysM peptidoglycan-binding domain-containing protein [Vicinamibacterales bacterium]